MSIKSVKAVINGQEYNLILNQSTGKYEATITAPSKSSYPKEGHYYPVTLTAEDDAGNKTTVNDQSATIGEDLRLQVKEKVKPVITITSPGADAVLTNNKPQISFTITDDDSGVNPDSLKITIGSTVIPASKITKTPITNGYTCTYTVETALSDGQNIIKVDGSDFDGNAADQKSVTTKVDTVPPTLNITSPVEGTTTNNNKVTVAGTTNDATSSPVTVTIKLNNVDQGDVTVGSGGAFSKEITLENGINTIVITATDSAGKTTSVTRTVTLNTSAPIFVSATITPNPVDSGNTFIISVEVTDE